MRLRNRVQSANRRDVEFSLWRSHVFWYLWLAFLLSTIGSFLLLLSLSGILYVQESSALLAGAVFAAQWTAPLIFARLLHWVCAKSRSRSWLVVMELGGAVTSVLLAFAVFFGLLVPAVGLLLVRGFTDSAAKTLRLVVMREALPQQALAAAGAVFNTSYFVGSGVGGLIGAWLVGVADVRVLGIVDSATFLAAALCYAIVWSRLPESTRAAQPPDVRDRRGIRALPAELRTTILISVVNVTMLQGLHIIARTGLPFDYWMTGQSGVAVTQLVACTALFTGAICGGYLTRFRERSVTLPVVLMIGSAAVVPALSFIPVQATAMLFYFGFLFLFECAYGLLAGRILALTTRGSSGPALVTSEIWHTLGIVTGILGIGAVVDLVTVRAAPVVAALGVAVVLSGVALARLRPGGEKLVGVRSRGPSCPPQKMPT